MTIPTISSPAVKCSSRAEHNVNGSHNSDANDLVLLKNRKGLERVSLDREAGYNKQEQTTYSSNK